MADDDWGADWESTRQRQRRSSFDSTTEARVAWLEMAVELAHAAGALPRRRNGQVGNARVWLGHLRSEALVADTLASELEALGVTVAMDEYGAVDDDRIRERAQAAARAGASVVWVAERGGVLPKLGLDDVLLVRCADGECEVDTIERGRHWLRVARHIVFGRRTKR